METTAQTPPGRPVQAAVPPLRPLAKAALALEVFLSVGALGGGAALLLGTRGELLRMPVSVLEGSPFTTFLVPGLVLFCVLGLGPLAAAALILRRHRLAAIGAGLVGIALLGFLAVEIAVIGYSNEPPLQPFYLALGAALVALGLVWWARQERPQRPVPFIVVWSCLLLAAALEIAAGVQSFRFRQFVARDAGRLFALRGEGAPLHRFDALPAPVLRYAEVSGARAHAPVRSARLRHGGTFRVALDRAPQAIEGEQYFSSDLPGFVWWGRISMTPGLWVDARDACLAGEGNMLVRVESTFTVADGRGPDYDEGSLLRLLAELPWLPTALFDERYVTWTAVDANHARATLRLRGREVSAVFTFGADGLITRVDAERPRGDGTRAGWGGEYSDYRGVDGLRVPFVAGVFWRVGGVTTEYAHWTIEVLELDRPGPF
jgi:hypothetical protein